MAVPKLYTKGITAGFSKNKDARDMALVVYNRLVEKGKYHTSLDPTIKSYATLYGDLMKLLRAETDEVDYELMANKNKCVTKLITIEKRLDLMGLVDEVVNMGEGEQEEYMEQTMATNIPGL